MPNIIIFSACRFATYDRHVAKKNKYQFPGFIPDLSINFLNSLFSRFFSVYLQLSNILWYSNISTVSISIPYYKGIGYQFLYNPHYLSSLILHHLLTNSASGQVLTHSYPRQWYPHTLPLKIYTQWELLIIHASVAMHTHPKQPSFPASRCDVRLRLRLRLRLLGFGLGLGLYLGLGLGLDVGLALRQETRVSAGKGKYIKGYS